MTTCTDIQEHANVSVKLIFANIELAAATERLRNSAEAADKAGLGHSDRTLPELEARRILYDLARRKVDDLKEAEANASFAVWHAL